MPMIASLMLWNEPNNLSRWDSQMGDLNTVGVHGAPLDWNHWKIDA